MLRLCLALTMFLCTVGLAMAQRAPVCDLCRRSIEGAYRVYEGGTGRARITVCESCEATLAKCTLCNIPTRNKADKAGTVVCDACRRSAKKCDVCANWLRGAFQEYQIDGHREPHRVCSACAKSAYRCTGCNVPHSVYEMGLYRDTERWCRACLDKATRCTLCKSPVKGLAYGIEHVDGTWCADCWKSKPKCSYCSRPMEQEAAATLDGRKLCHACHKSSVSGGDRMRYIASKIAPEFEALLGKPISVPEMEAVTNAQLHEAREKPGEWTDVSKKTFLKPIEAPVVKELGLFQTNGVDSRILILDTMPEDQAWETVAHELAHAWQAAHYPQCEDPVLVEGFAQWMASRILMKTGRRSGLERLRKRADSYGEAYRMVQRIADDLGEERVMKCLKENKLPKGYQ